MNEIELLGDQIAEVAAHIDAATHRLLTLIRAFDEKQGWGQQGALSCAHWLSWRVGLALGAAREKVRVARALGGLPELDQALKHGRISYSQVRAITRVATAANEKDLLEIARHSTGGQLERLCRKYRQVLAVEKGNASADAERYVRRADTEDGLVRIEACLRPEEAAIVWKAMDAMRSVLRGWKDAKETGDVSAETSRGALRPGRADALVALAETFLREGAPKRPVGSPCEVVIHVDRAALGSRGAAEAAVLEDGTPVGTETARRFSCDCGIVEEVDGPDGKPLDVGRRTRAIPAALRRALRARDGGCRFPGCTNLLYVDGHHVEHWAHGGETKLSNLVELCRFHHRLVHEGGFTVRTREDGSFTFHDPVGTPIDEVPPRAPVKGDGFEGLVAWNEQAGLEIDASTAFPRWEGERMNYGWTLDVLLAQPRRT